MSRSWRRSRKGGGFRRRWVGISLLTALLEVLGGCDGSDTHQGDAGTTRAVGAEGGSSGAIEDVCAPSAAGADNWDSVLREWCSLPQQPGTCDGNHPMYWFNGDTGQCEPFTYSGCEGNHNRWELVDCLQSCACQQSTGRPDGCPCATSSQCSGECIAQAPGDPEAADPCALAWTAVCRSEPTTGCYCVLPAGTDGTPEVRCADAGTVADDSACAAGPCIAPLRYHECCDEARFGICGAKPWGCHCMVGFYERTTDANTTVCVDPGP